MGAVTVDVEFNGIGASSSKSDGCLADDVDDVSEIERKLSAGFVLVVLGDAIGSSTRVMIEEFSSLQSPKVKGKGKGRGRGSKNRFEVLQEVDPEDEVWMLGHHT
ncbi:hypothetical protein V6N12_018959 [Hibiscus sabdariffa]|uniref:Uncharacterized protein n=1 Tax=Hibiscus sabdariffa TaxID=183260 RepID=A0ABR2AZA9_9ROSI